MQNSSDISQPSTLQSVDPSSVPFRNLPSGDKMPAIGLGTFGSDHVSDVEIAEAVNQAIDIGYRHIDCASVYGNEPQLGTVFNSRLESGFPREDLWITSKVWNDMHGEDNVIESCKQSLRDLQLDYLDLYLVHWPFPNFHPKGCDVSSRSPDAKPFLLEDFMSTWRGMETLIDEGLVRNIGTSNVTRAKLDQILPEARIKPSVNEMELHPHFQQSDLFEYVLGKGIQPVGFCPIGSPARPERDRTPEDTSPTEDSVIQEIANSHGIHPATLCVKWAEQRGQIPIPFSTNPRNMFSNIHSLTTAPLSEEEMKLIETRDRDCRLIKGQVFLWKEDQTWEDLWDLDGHIAQ